ncbi:MAG: pitrilysin family protein [Syntrophales bacterium]|jgi:predicted Zn-dependent peptidase|nr:pitrilysin family protein [Syntrophales bacterium]
MYHKTVLDNGVRILSERIPHVRSISIGAWVRSGSRYESPETNGMAHFIEHMLFKGTRSRTAFDIASLIDSVGGLMNAVTGKEWTSFYLKIPDYHLTLSIDLLSDIFKNSLFDEDDIRKEKMVVLQEIHMLEDSPGEYIHDLFEGRFWTGHPLGRSVLGKVKVVENFQRDAILRFFQERYGGDRLIITAAGCLDHDPLVKMLTNSFTGTGRTGGTRQEPCDEPRPRKTIAVWEKDLEQVHLVIGSTAPSSVNPRRFAGFVLNAALGGNMSSVLFQEVREKRGLAYSIYSYLNSYADAGLIGIYAGVDKGDFAEVVDLVLAALRRMAGGRLSEEELARAKESLKGSYLLSMESTDNRMSRLARNEIHFGRSVPVEEVIAQIEAVSAEDVRSLAEEMFDPRLLSLAVTGPISERDAKLP